MELFLQLNYLAILVAALAHFAFGAIWYTPLFGKKWGELVGMKMDSSKGGASIAVPMILQLVNTFIMVVGLAYFIRLAPQQDLGSALLIGGLLGILIQTTAHAPKAFFQGKPALFLIDGGYQLIGTLIAALILGVWK